MTSYSTNLLRHSEASFLLLFTIAVTSPPHTSVGLRPFSKPSTCLRYSDASSTTQFSTKSGSEGSHLVKIYLLGTTFGGISERPRCKSSRIYATSISSMGRRLMTCRWMENYRKHSEAELTWCSHRSFSLHVHAIRGEASHIVFSCSLPITGSLLADRQAHRGHMPLRLSRR